MSEECPGLSLTARQGCHGELLKTQLVGATLLMVELYEALGSLSKAAAASHVQSCQDGCGFNGFQQGCIQSADNLAY